MTYLLGTDEAGYGPNLGPLTISASLWEVPEGVRGDGLYDLLKSVIAPPTSALGQSGGRTGVAIADSKTALPIAEGA